MVEKIGEVYQPVLVRMEEIDMKSMSLFGAPVTLCPKTMRVTQGNHRFYAATLTKIPIYARCGKKHLKLSFV